MDSKESLDPTVAGFTPPKTNIDTKNDGLEDVSPLKHGVILGSYVSFQGSKPSTCRSGPFERNMFRILRMTPILCALCARSSWIYVDKNWVRCFL